MPHLDDLNRFYDLIEKLKMICNSELGFENWIDIKLTNCNGRLPYWKKCKRGIYFFFDENEKRFDSDNLRVVRVGTHAIKRSIGESTLWGRLKQHKGNDENMGGNHRGSIFRILVGQAMINRDDLNCPTWGHGNTAKGETRIGEGGYDGGGLEGEVSKYIRNLPFIFLRVDPESDNKEYLANCNDRKYLEKNIIGLLSDRENPDEPSDNWLGKYSSRDRVRNSGLWQSNGVGHPYDKNFFNVFENYITLMQCRRKFLKKTLVAKMCKSLILIPCCSRKRADGNNKEWGEVKQHQESNKFQFLNDAREKMIDFYSNLTESNGLNNYQRGGDNQAEKRAEAWQKNLNIPQSRTMKAIDRYSGNLYSILSDDIKISLGCGDIKNVWIVSALMGIIAPTDLIPDYNLMMGDKSPADISVWKFWKNEFNNDNVELQLRNLFSKYEYVYCLLSTTTGYFNSVKDIFLNSNLYCVIPRENGQRNKLMSWGKVLNDAIIESAYAPDDVRIIAERHNCNLNLCSKSIPNGE